MRRSSSWFGTTMSMSWILVLVVTLHPLHGTRVRLPTPQRTHDSQEPPPQRMLLGGGHWNRVDGHTGKHGWTRTEEATSGEGEGCERLATREGNTGEGSALGAQHGQGTVRQSRRWFTGCVAKNCHPCFGVDGSSPNEGGGRRPPARSSHPGASNPASTKTWRAPAAPSKWIPVPRPSFQRTNQDLRNLRVTVPHHFEGIAPTGPICRMPDPLCAQGAQPSQRQWQTGHVPSALWNLRSQQLEQTPPRRPCR